jgi:2'-5' RNA ligase
MRLFVAVDLPDGLKTYLSSVASQLKSDTATVAIAKELHVTLKFLGDVAEEHIEDIERRLSSIAFRSFQTKLGTVGTFGEGRETSVVWGGVEPVDAWRKLAKEVDRKLPEFKNDYPVFNPHITFARVKKVIAVEAFKELVASIELDHRMFEVSKFTLIQSIPGLEGHRYKVIRTYDAQNF